MTSTLSLNGLDAVSVRLFHPWTGVWSADVDLDLAAVPVVPTGPAVIVIGTASLVGTIDPDASGKFGEKARVRVLGGGGGWHRNVSARQFHNEAGVLSSLVITATAAEVGEAAVVAVPAALGIDYMRTAGPASRTLAGLDWYVSLAGVTTVAPRLPLPAPIDVDVLEFEPDSRIANLASDSIILPGTVLLSPLFGTATVRDIEQTFTADGGARATAWCDKAATSRLAFMLTALVAERGRLSTLKTYHYRVVLQAPDGRLTLQAVSRTSGAPDSLTLPPWYGVPGLKSLVTLGSECAVEFLDGDPSKPVVTAFHGGDTLASGVATQLSMAALLAALQTMATTLAAFAAAPSIAALSGGTSASAAAAATALATAAASPSVFSLKTMAP